MSAPEVVDHLVLPAADGPVVLARAQWPATRDDTLTPIAGFVLSTFSPLVAEVAERCLRARYGAPPARPAHAGATALVLASAHGDVTTDELARSSAAAGERVPPLLFFQSNPNAVLGWIAARWDLSGPVLSIAPTGDLLADAGAVAGLLLADGEAAEVLVVAAELDPDRAEAVLLGRAAEMSVVLPADPVPVPAELIVPEPPTVPAAELVLTKPTVPAELVLTEPTVPAGPVLTEPTVPGGPVLAEPVPAPGLILPTAVEES